MGREALQREPREVLHHPGHQSHHGQDEGGREGGEWRDGWERER